MQNYKDLKVWDKAHQLTLCIYKESKAFPKEELYCLTTQLRRSSFSVAANIAEGCGKNSSADFANFFNIALGSANETEYFLLLAKDLHYLEGATFEALSAEVNEIKAMLISLISRVRTPKA